MPKTKKTPPARSSKTTAQKKTKKRTRSTRPRVLVTDAQQAMLDRDAEMRKKRAAQKKKALAESGDRRTVKRKKVKVVRDDQKTKQWTIRTTTRNGTTFK